MNDKNTDETLSGTLVLEARSGRAAALSVLCATLLTAGLLSLTLRRVSLTGWSLGIAAAVLAYVLYRVLYPELSRLFGGGVRRAAWTLTADALTLDGRTVPREAIIKVHVWPSRDALGHTLSGWTVNIETTGRNLLLRSLAAGADAAESKAELERLASALGEQFE